MQDYPSIAWLLLALTCLVAGMSLIPSVRRRWHWGRTGTSVPMSAVGVVAGVMTLGLLTAAAFEFVPFFAIFLSIPMLAVAGLYDSWRHSRADRRTGERR